MTVTLSQDFTFDDVLHICRNLRERDREEIFAMRFTDDPDQLAADVSTSYGRMVWCAYADGVPVAMVGAMPPWPGTWSAFAFGTDDWPRVVMSLTRLARTFLMPAIYNSGARRAICYALDTHTDARAWLSLLGMEPEQVLPRWGKNGETFVLYSWCRFRTRQFLGRAANVRRRRQGR
jgi:hypothetical protein